LTDIADDYFDFVTIDLIGGSGGPLFPYLPVPQIPELSTQLVGGDSGLQPRPGNLPGQYLLETAGAGNAQRIYHQYGGPLGSGANPQTTAVFTAAQTNGPPLPFITCGNNLSGAKLFHYVTGTAPFTPFIEVKHPDGTIARFESFTVYTGGFNPTPGHVLWRLKTITDPFDNVATYTYDGANRLTQIAFPSGLRQEWLYSTQDSGGFSYDIVDLRYFVGTTQPAEASARNTRIVFSRGPLPQTLGRRYFGARLYRTYAPAFPIVPDSATGPYTQPEVTGVPVREFTYTQSPQRIEEKQIIHGGTDFPLILQPSGIDDMAVMLSEFSSGRLFSRTDLRTGESMAIVFSTLPSGRAVTEVTRLRTPTAGTVTRIEYDPVDGKVFLTRTTPEANFYGQPRVADASGPNLGIGGVAATAVEPDWIEIEDEFGPNCVCAKPTTRRVRSSRNGQLTVRTFEFEYHPENNRLTRKREPNPSSDTGLPVEWSYTYTQHAVAGGDWGPWLLHTESEPGPTRPDGTLAPPTTYTYAYSEGINRQAAQRHGRMYRTVTRTLTNVTLQTGLNSTATGASVSQVLWRNLSNLPASHPPIAGPKGQPRRLLDGDGVETTFDYVAGSGFPLAEVTGGRRTAFVRDGVGNLTAITENATAAVALRATTTFTLILGWGEPSEAQTTVDGVLRKSTYGHDRFGHLARERRYNRGSANGKPVQYGQAPGSARDWVEDQYHYLGDRLVEEYQDRQSLNEAASTNQFLATLYNYGLDGRLVSMRHPNGAITTYTFDGYGTLYAAVTAAPTGTQTVASPKRFVNQFLEVVGTYQFTGTANEHLWTTVTRNAAGAVTQIEEPTGQVPTGTIPSGMTPFGVGGARHAYQLDRLGRVIRADSLSGAVTLTTSAMVYDEMGRQVLDRDVIVGASNPSDPASSNSTAWQYGSGKETQVQSIHRTGVASIQYTYFASGPAAGLLNTTNFGGSTNQHVYHGDTAFLSRVDRHDADPAGTRHTAIEYDVNAFGQVKQLREMNTGGALALPWHGNGTVPGPSQANFLLHQYFYNSHGRVDRYLDPMYREQRFLADGRARLVEHVRLGDGGSYIHNGIVYEDNQALTTDGRTKMTRTDDHGNTTITHWDFASRPFIVQNPGGTTVPTSTSKHQAMCLYAEYDGASRLKSLYDGDLGRTDLYRDGRGRVTKRQLVNGSSSGTPFISLWNTNDWIQRDAIGRILRTNHLGDANGAVPMTSEAFTRDSLGRMTQERFGNAFASSHMIDVNSSFDGADRRRKGLGYADSLGLESLSMTMGHDTLGRLQQINWDKAAGGGMQMLAQYEYAGEIRRKRTLRLAGNNTQPRIETEWKYDAMGRLTAIQDRRFAAGGPVGGEVVSEFAYEYDAASNLIRERYSKMNGRKGDRFANDAYHRLSQGWMGVDQATMDAVANPTAFSAAAITEHLTYGLDDANNRTTSSSQTSASGPVTTSYTRQIAGPQGPSNRYHTTNTVGGTGLVQLNYDNRGNLTYDGQFVFRYDFMNRLQEVWKVVPPAPVDEDTQFAEVQAGSMEGAEDAVKADIPDLYTRLAREHTDPAFRARLRATIQGGIIQITPTPQGGGGRPGWFPINGTLELAAVYTYDAFNRRAMSILVDPSVGETQFHAWDGWRQTSQHKLENVNGTPRATPTKQFLWGSTLDELVSYRRLGTNGWETYHIVPGGQDTAAKLVDSTGTIMEQYEYDAYGKMSCYSLVSGFWTRSAKSNFGLPFLWKSVRLDDVTGLLQMRHRYYSSALGRFLTTDPLGAWGDLANVGNEVAYAGNSPMTHSDELGLQGKVHVIVSHFASIKGESANISADVAESVSDALTAAGHSNEKIELPVEWDAATEALNAAVDKATKRGDRVVVVGLGKWFGVQIETRGRNKRGDYTDNTGGGGGGQNDPGGPAQVNLPMPKFYEDLFGISLSSDAGEWICEEVTYSIYLNLRRRRIKQGVFVHVNDNVTKEQTARIAAGALALADLEKAMLFK
jgi:RHS repeat-associated protein